MAYPMLTSGMSFPKSYLGFKENVPPSVLISFVNCTFDNDTDLEPALERDEAYWPNALSVTQDWHVSLRTPIYRINRDDVLLESVDKTYQLAPTVAPKFHTPWHVRPGREYLAY